MSLPFDPLCLPLLLGSLPHTNAAQALEQMRRYGGVLLAWPQLPQRSFREQAVPQSAAGFPGLVIDEAKAQAYVQRGQAQRELDRLALAYLVNDINYGALPPAFAAGLDALLQQGDNLRGALVLKGQTLGPISLGAQLTDERQRPLIYDEQLFTAIVQHTRLRVMWQEQQLGELSGATIMCLDEPFLEMVGLPFAPFGWDSARAALDEVFGVIIGCKALYAGGAVHWSEVLQTSVELIVADVYAHGDELLRAVPALADFLQRDGTVGLGLIPADADELRLATADALLRRLKKLIAQLGEAGIAPEQMLRQSLISTTAGLGQLDTTHAERALQLVGQVSAQLREQYRLTA